jgi:hypothetical protein
MLLRDHARRTDESSSASDKPAWILVGGLEQALQQSGIVAALFERGIIAGHVIGSGYACVNAILAATGDSATFVRGWERLRQRHFLPRAAFCAGRFLGTVNGLVDALAGDIAEALPATNGATSEAAHVLVTLDDGFVALPPDASSSEWRSAVKQTLRKAGVASPALVAAAIREAAGLSGHVVVIGIERTAQAHPDVEAASRSARAVGASVAFIAAVAPRKISLIEYLLPGSGAPERLQREGFTSAARWLWSNGHGGQRPFPGQSSFALTASVFEGETGSESVTDG